jgi:3-hydroxy acid dehydrogenase/malonic semialdehyde reductase
MVETNFSITRFRGDETAAAKVYQDVQPLVAYDIGASLLHPTPFPWY